MIRQASTTEQEFFLPVAPGGRVRLWSAHIAVSAGGSPGRCSLVLMAGGAIVWYLSPPQPAASDSAQYYLTFGGGGGITSWTVGSEVHASIGGPLLPVFDDDDGAKIRVDFPGGSSQFVIINYEPFLPSRKGRAKPVSPELVT